MASPYIPFCSICGTTVSVPIETRSHRKYHVGCFLEWAWRPTIYDYETNRCSREDRGNLQAVQYYELPYNTEEILTLTVETGGGGKFSFPVLPTTRIKHVKEFLCFKRGQYSVTSPAELVELIFQTTLKLKKEGVQQNPYSPRDIALLRAPSKELPSTAEYAATLLKSGLSSMACNTLLLWHAHDLRNAKEPLQGKETFSYYSIKVKETYFLSVVTKAISCCDDCFATGNDSIMRRCNELNLHQE